MASGHVYINISAGKVKYKVKNDFFSSMIFVTLSPLEDPGWEKAAVYLLELLPLMHSSEIHFIMEIRPAFVLHCRTSYRFIPYLTGLY